MAVDKERIKLLLGYITDHTRVAHIAGCEISYISQLMADPDFAEGVMLARIEQGEKTVGMDRKADDLEDMLLDKLKRSIPMMFKPSEILRAYQVVNSAKRRVPVDSVGSGSGGGTVLNLRIPARTALKFKMDSAGEVIEIEGKPLVTMPSVQLLRKMNERGSAHGQELEALSNRLVSYSEATGAAGEAGGLAKLGGGG